MNDIILRAAANLPLKNWERAILKAGGGILMAGILAAISLAVTALTHNQTLATIGTGGIIGAFLLGMVNALSKLMAQSDNPIAEKSAPVVEAVGAQVATTIASRIDANQAKTPQ